jgi:hypothetical protein
MYFTEVEAVIVRNRADYLLGQHTGGPSGTPAR